MWTARNRHFAHQFFNADDGNPAGGGGGANPPETPPTPPAKPEFDDTQQQFINDLVAKERKAAEEKTALRLKAEAEAKAQADKDARERDEAAARGEFDSVRADLESRVTTIEGERDALATEADALRTYFDAQYQAALKDLPDVVTAFKPSDEASFAEKSAWLTKAQEQAAKVAGTQAPGNRPNPNAANGNIDLKAETAKAKANGKYRI